MLPASSQQPRSTYNKSGGPKRLLNQGLLLSQQLWGGGASSHFLCLLQLSGRRFYFCPDHTATFELSLLPQPQMADGCVACRGNPSLLIWKHHSRLFLFSPSFSRSDASLCSAMALELRGRPTPLPPPPPRKADDARGGARLPKSV